MGEDEDFNVVRPRGYEAPQGSETVSAGGSESGVMKWVNQVRDTEHSPVVARYAQGQGLKERSRLVFAKVRQHA